MLTEQGYRFYDSKRAVSSGQLQHLYTFTRWGRGRSLEQIDRMINSSSLCFSVYYEENMIAFCRILTDFVFRASLWDIMVHPDHQGKGLGSALLNYAIFHPAVKDIPLIITYTSELGPFLKQHGFTDDEGAMMLLRCPIEYS